MTACKSHWMKVLELFQRMKHLKLIPVTRMGWDELWKSEQKRQEIQCFPAAACFQPAAFLEVWLEISNSMFFDC
jgi:hypothetical protein